MKNIKAIGLILLALLTGLAAAVYAAGWISRQSGIASNKVVVAAVDIELGSRVNAQMLSTVDWPSGSVPNGSFSDIKALDDRVVKVGVLRGEAIMEGKLAPVGIQGGLSAVIASGKRAMTVRVNDVVGVAGFALPGNYVDVMVNAQQDKSRGEQASQISKTMLEKVLVLAVAQEANRDDTKPKVVSAVTLELSLEDSEKLDLAALVHGAVVFPRLDASAQWRDDRDKAQVKRKLPSLVAFIGAIHEQMQRPIRRAQGKRPANAS